MTTSTLVIISYHPDLGHRHNDHWWLDSAPCALRGHPQHACKILFHSPLISSGSLDHSWLWLIQQSFHPWDHCHSQFVYKFSFSHCEYTGKTFHFRLNELAKRAYVISLMSFWIELLFQGPQLPQASLSLLYVSPVLLVYLQWTPQTSFRWAYWLYWIEQKGSIPTVQSHDLLGYLLFNSGR